MMYIRFPNVPPSVNAAYESHIVTKGRGPARKRIALRRLSDEGKSYKSAIKKHVLQEYGQSLQFFKENVPYLIVVEFVFHGRDTLYNSTWFGDDSKNQAKSRYKTFDATNRTKLFEDALAEAVGIDDRHNFFVGVSKTWARDYEATNCWVFNREAEEDNPVDELFRKLRALSGPEPH